jgi:hypothetical protein
MFDPAGAAKVGRMAGGARFAEAEKRRDAMVTDAHGAAVRF